MENLYQFNNQLNFLEKLEIAEDEAFASITLNPTVTWTKFVLTDDLPNANRQRVPEDEFSNLIKTGVYMPIKMAVGGILPGHEEAVPLGVITHLQKKGNQVLGLAALWERERPEDVELIKSARSSGQSLELSWEILYASSTVTEDGVQELRDTALRAVTLVGRPAYEGRTSVIALSSVQTEQSEDSKLDNQELLDKVAQLEAALAEKESKIYELTAKQSETEQALAELESLRAYKNEIEQAKAEASKLASIKQKFSEAGIAKDEQYFADNGKKLIDMSDEMLEFFMQELVASFASKEQKEGSASLQPSGTKLPNFSADKDGEIGINQLAEYLRTSKRS